MSTASIPRPEAEYGIGAGQLCAQAEATHTQGMQLPFIYPPQPLTMGREGFPWSLLHLFQKKYQVMR